MKLKHEIVEVSKISDDQKKEMYQLLDKHYANVNWHDFISDLSEKQWVILLFSMDSEKLAGFSTQMLISPGSQPGFENILVLYSGDTIIAHEYWGSVTLPVAFLQLVYKIQKLYPEKRIFWMLISKGLRTYKFLSVFLNEYFPNHLSETPENIRELMVIMGTKKFGPRFRSETGIIEAEVGGQFLKEEFQPAENTNNAVARFFFTRNPGYNKGDELLCLAEICDTNLHPFIKRVERNYDLQA
jgi:hypothetical protein